MFSFIQLFAIVAAISTAHGATYRVTKPRTDYYLYSQRELMHNIALVNVQIAEVDAYILDRIDVIAYEQEQLLNEIKAVNRTYFPLQALSLPRRRCIQKYYANFITYDSAAYQLALCYELASDSAAYYTNTAKAKIIDANIYVTGTFPYTISKCEEDYAKSNKDALEDCYIAQFNSVNDVVNQQLNDAKDFLKQALLDSMDACKSATRCSFKVLKNVLKTIGQTNLSMQICEACFESSNSTAEC